MRLRILKPMLLFLSIRTLMAFISRSWHVPDETWQSVEISHKIVFGRGHQTWEWHHQIRSHLHPLLYVPGFYALKLLHLDRQFLVELVPRLTQGLVAVVGDVCFLRFYEAQYGPDDWFLWIYSTNFFLNFCSSRTLVNTFEMSLTSIALYLYPVKDSSLSNLGFLYVIVIALSFMIRATTTIFWLPLVLFHVYKLLINGKISYLFTHMIPFAVLALCLGIAVDSYYYNEPYVFIPWNFFKMNVLMDVSSLYGLNYPLWYLTHTLPVLMGINLIPFLLGIWEDRTIWAKNAICSLILYSCIGHKEQRFILPLLPLFCAFASQGLHKNKRQWQKWISARRMKQLLVVTNLPFLAYFSLIHQSGTTQVIRDLSHIMDASTRDSVTFLMPCHSTPLYSHLHLDVKARFLTCEPNLVRLANYEDEATIFFANPLKFLNKNEKFDVSSHLVIYENIADRLSPYLHTHKYSLMKSIFHTHLPDGQAAKRIMLFSRN